MMWLVTLIGLVFIQGTTSYIASAIWKPPLLGRPVYGLRCRDRMSRYSVSWPLLQQSTFTTDADQQPQAGADVPLSPIPDARDNNAHNSIDEAFANDLSAGSIAFKFLILNPHYQRLTRPIHYGPHILIKGNILNFWGISYAIVTFVVALFILPIMFVLASIEDIIGNGTRRRSLDWAVHLWARLSLLLSPGSFGSWPKLYGAEHLPRLEPAGWARSTPVRSATGSATGSRIEDVGEKERKREGEEVVVYIPNHTCFFDILLLSGVLPRPFKYLSKSEVLRIPLVGTGMRLAKHVFLRRNDMRSTIQCGETIKQRLRDGNSVVLFAEGTRSPDGRLRSFKKGAFQMAKEADCRVVPVSIGNLHRYMPDNCPLPVAPIRAAYIKVHPAIETRGRKIKDIKRECFEAVNAGLPPYQKFDPSILL